MPRLAFALISVLAHVAAQEARITDLVKAEYTDEGCAAAGWGPFPTANATTLTAEAYSTPATLLVLGPFIRTFARGSSP